jgi:menaquinone-dependent protoporphyrinogen oxidase
MTVLIAYASKYGTTAARARAIASTIRADVTLVDLRRHPYPDPMRFDAVLIGGSIYGGRIQRRVSGFCELRGEALRARPVGLFICCLSRGAHARAQMEDAFPGWLREAAICRAFPGGALNPAGLTLLDRFLVRSVPHPPGIIDRTDPAEIGAAADAVNRLVT